MEQKCANCGNGKWRDGVTAITDNCIECKYVNKDGKLWLSNWKPKVSSNADRIRAMNDEELANMLTDFSNNGGWVTEIGREICYERHIEWLKQPAEENDYD